MLATWCWTTAQMVGASKVCWVSCLACRWSKSHRWCRSSSVRTPGLADLARSLRGKKLVTLQPTLVIWVWVNTYRYIFSGMNIHLPAILGFTRYQGFDPSPFGLGIWWDLIDFMGMDGNSWDFVGFYCEIMRILWDFVGLLCNLMGFYGDPWEFKQKNKVQCGAPRILQ